MRHARRVSVLAGAALAIVTATAAAQAPVVTSPPGGVPIRTAPAPSGPRVLAYWTVAQNGVQRLEAAERGADGAWSAPVVIATQRGTGSPVIALNARGEAVLAWYLVDGAGQRLMVATRTAAGSWSPLRRLAGAARLGPPELNLAADGTAVVGWGEVRGLTRRTRVRVSVRRPGAPFGAPRPVGTAPPASSPLEEIDFRALPGGRAAAAWSASGETSVVRYRAGRWGAPAVLRVTRLGTWAVRLSPAGAAFTSWFAPVAGARGNGNAVQGRMFAAVAPPGRGWRRARVVSGAPAAIGVENVFFFGTAMYLDDAGRAYAAWIRFPRLPGAGPRAVVGARGVVVVATGTASGWSAGRRVSAAGGNAAALDLDGGGAGATVGWIEAVPGAGNERAFASRSNPAGTAWEAPVPLFAPGAITLPEPAGLTVVQWPDRSASVSFGAATDRPVLLRPAGAAAWRPVTVVEPGVFGAVNPAALLVASDGAAFAEQWRYGAAAYAEATSFSVLVPVPGP